MTERQKAMRRPHDEPDVWAAPIVVALLVLLPCLALGRLLWMGWRAWQ